MTEKDTTGLLVRWRTNCLRSQIANYDAANIFSERNYWLGIPVIVLSTIVGTTVFSSIQATELNQNHQIIVGLISLSAAILSALQTFLKWGEVAAKFQSAGTEYGVLKREIDQLLAMGESESEEAFSSIRGKMDSISRDAPELPNKIWERASKKIPRVTDQ